MARPRHATRRAAADAVQRVGSCRSGGRFSHRNPRALDTASTSVKTPIRFHCLPGELGAANPTEDLSVHTTNASRWIAM
jgi:hypothetical protein